MEIILNAPYIIRIITSLFIILIVNKLSRQLSISMLAGILVLALWTGHNFQDITKIAWDKFSSLNNIFLLIVVFQVIWLSSQMSITGVMKELVDSINSRVSQRASMALLPAVIGLLPMPGGAIFSAPLVDDCDHDKSIAPILKTKINYWFRHVWEYWWPLYPGVLLAVEITGLSILQFMVLMFPMSLFSVLGGYLFLLRKIKRKDTNNHFLEKSTVIELIILIMPIIVIIICYGLINLFIPEISKINRYLPMIMGICTAQLILQIMNPIGIIAWKEIIFSSKTFKLVLVVVLVLIYGAFIGARLTDGSMIMSHMRNELNYLGIPFILIIVLIPFISGLTTGIAVGFVGASFPIVMSLLGSNPGLNLLMSTIVLAYSAGYIGIILSPVHVCLIVTNEHFKTSIAESIIKLTRPALVVLIASFIMYLVLK